MKSRDYFIKWETSKCANNVFYSYATILGRSADGKNIVDSLINICVSDIERAKGIIIEKTDVNILILTLLQENDNL